jgi:hypothetical protein
MKSKTFLNEYKRLRSLNYTAKLAYEHACLHEQWEELESNEVVEFLVEYDGEPYDDSYTETEKEKKDLWERIAREGVYNIVGRVKLNDTWHDIDSVCGFIGDDWKDSGYDYDVKHSAIEAYHNSSIAANI